MLVHNHPSGSVSPSSDDCKVTKEMVKAGRGRRTTFTSHRTALKVIGIEVIDHVITAGESYFSFREEGILATT